ncbi:MAG: hypothetical protein ACF8Q5_01445 [Phycisphaerales bacterium JB040]
MRTTVRLRLVGLASVRIGRGVRIRRGLWPHRERRHRLGHGFPSGLPGVLGP